MEKFFEFLRHYLSMQQNRIRQERLFKIVREFMKDNQQALELLEQPDGKKTWPGGGFTFGSPTSRFSLTNTLNPDALQL